MQVNLPNNYKGRFLSIVKAIFSASKKKSGATSMIDEILEKCENRISAPWGTAHPGSPVRHCVEFSDAAAERHREEGERRGGRESERESGVRIVPAGRQGRTADVADYRPGLRSGLTPAPAAGNPSYRPAGRLAGDTALYAMSVWWRWDQQCLSRFRSRSALRLGEPPCSYVSGVSSPRCQLGACIVHAYDAYTRARRRNTHQHATHTHAHPRKANI